MAKLSEATKPPVDEDPSRTDRDGVLDYVASHPSGRERIERARRYGECFARGETRCEVD